MFVPVGGGGLIAGIAGYIKSLRPDVKVIGVEPFEADAMYRSLQAGRRVRLDHVGIFADGVAVREVGQRTFAIVQQTVDEVVRVTNDEACAAIKDIFDDTRSVMEPAGALATAGLASGSSAKASRPVAGGGPERRQHELRSAALRGRARRARRGARGAAGGHPARAPRRLPRVCAALGRRVVTEFNYRLSGRETAHIFIGVATESKPGRRGAGSPAQRRRLPDGGSDRQRDGQAARAPHGRRPRAGRAQRAAVPVRVPGAPRRADRVLDKLGGRWNVSLFHYRNHGADFGRVLAGFEVSDEDLPAFRAFLDALGYPFTPESDNPAYRFFLG